MMEDHQLGGKLLAGVSRSFYLTLKALPEGLREPLSLAYLLARTADTIADTASVSGEVRMECLREYELLTQKSVRDEVGERRLQERLDRDFRPQQTEADEAKLLARLPEIFQALQRTPAAQAEHIRQVLATIIKGQTLDIQRFPSDGTWHALQTTDDLDEYTYLVAGCVGGFWTKLCAENPQPVLSGEKAMEDMMLLGIRYGKGLQLVNILRDVGKDLGMGRCYFPVEELKQHGLTLDDVRVDPARLAPVMAPWGKLCREHLICGLDYLRGLLPGRLVYATALPLLLGVRTLSKVEQADWAALSKGVKVSRTGVAKLMFDAGVASMKKGGVVNLVERLLDMSSGGK